MLRGVKFLIEYILSVFKVSCLFLCALMLPRIFLYYMAHKQPKPTQESELVFKLGLENISPDIIKQFISANRGRTGIALMTNHTGKDQAGRRNIDILRQHGLHLTAIITPKHGFNACLAEHKTVDACVDPLTRIPIISWDDAKRTNSDLLAGINLVIFDMQDSGMRYGYITTLLEVMRELSAQGKKLVVLDRPNLLGSYMEGACIESEIQNSSYIPVPIRHGMTVGELAQFFNKNLLDHPVQLSVIPMENYSRHAHVSKKVTYHVSPNIVNAASCYGYSFLGLLGEVQPFDIGVGTDKAFQLLMVPDYVGLTKQQWYDLRDILVKHGVDSKFHRMFHERKQQSYSGLKITIRDINSFSAFNTLLAVLTFFKQSGVTLTFSHRFDVALGTAKVREFFQDAVDFTELEGVINQDLMAFFNKAMSSFIYKPLPQVVRV